MSITGYDGPPWLRPLQLIAAGTSAGMRALTGMTLFIDGFRPSWRAALAWALLPALELVGFFVWFPWMGRVQEALSLLFVLAGGMARGGGPARRLVQRCRRLRPVLATRLFYSVGIIVGHALVRDIGWSGGGPSAPPDRTLEVAGLAASRSVRGAGAAGRRAHLCHAAAARARRGAAGRRRRKRESVRLPAPTEEEKIYRHEGFDPGALVAALDLPEDLLRRLINRRLGHRNSQFVNPIARPRPGRRRPTAQAEVPVLTVALDAGFQSIGLFTAPSRRRQG